MNEIRNITVIGAGDMGRGIAEVALISGFKVFLQDVEQGFVDRGVSRIYRSLDKLVEKGKVPEKRYQEIKDSLLMPVVNIEAAVKETDLVIEAIPEDLELKKATFARIDKAAPDHAILASNTSTMKISEIAAATGRPDRVAGLHYFNPAVLMRLVEVVRGDATSQETIDACKVFVKKNSKVPVVVRKDIPGFIVNRVQAPSNILLQSALDTNLVRPEEVDAMLRKSGMPMGPYEIMDFTGLDVAVGGCNYFSKHVHPDYAPGKTLVAKVKAGELGKKSGRGLYDWSGGRPEIDLEKTTDKLHPMDIAAVNINEATRLIEMEVCSAQDIDTAITSGTGSAKGPMAMARSMDPEELSGRLDRMADLFNKEIFRPTDMIRNGTYL